MRSGSGAGFVALALILVPTPRSFAAMAPGQRDSDDAARQSHVSRLPERSKRYALIVGVDQYQDPSINPLVAASNDANKLAESLVQHADFPADAVTVLASTLPLERQPTRANILSQLSRLRRLIPEDGLLLFSFAGHGIERDGKAYLLPLDAQLSGDVALLEDSSLSVELLRDRIRQTGVGQVLLLLDACRDNPSAARGESESRLTNEYTTELALAARNKGIKAFATIYATGVGQVAYEDRNRKRGYFSATLTDGLNGGAVDTRGQVTLSSLLSYVQDRVPRAVAADLGPSKKQYPFAIVEGYRAEQLVLGIANDRTRPSGPAAPVNTDPVAVEREYWEAIRDSNRPDDFVSYLKRYPDGIFAPIARERADPKTVSVSFRGEANTQVFIDKQFKGQLAGPAPSMLQVEVSPGRHTIRLYRPGFSTQEFDADFRALREMVPVALTPVPPATEYADDFRAGADNWTSPPAWRFAAGRLLVAGSRPGYLKNRTYGDFKLEFDLSFRNGGGAAWVVRATDAQTSYLFQLTGPKARIPNTFRSFLVRDGEATLLKSDPVPEKLGGQNAMIHMTVEAFGSVIKHSIQVSGAPNATGPQPLSTLVDNRLREGTIGFVAKDDNEFVVHFVAISPTYGDAPANVDPAASRR